MTRFVKGSNWERRTSLNPAARHSFCCASRALPVTAQTGCGATQEKSAGLSRGRGRSGHTTHVLPLDLARRFPAAQLADRLQASHDGPGDDAREQSVSRT